MSLAARLTLLSLLLRPIGSGWLRPAILALAVAGLVWPRALRSPALWLALAALAAWRVVGSWPLADNHAYLLAYWCLALGLARLAPDPPVALAWNARMLTGLVFAFAVLWKGLSPDYLDTRFFRVALVVDARLEPVATALAGLSGAALEERRAFLTQHVDGAEAARLDAPEPARLRAIAVAATWLTVGIELAVAAAFLAPLGRWAWLRHASLLVFCATTYAVAPVVSFGWLLLAMGVAQCEPAARRTRWAYRAVFVGLVVRSWAP